MFTEITREDNFSPRILLNKIKTKFPKISLKEPLVDF